MTSKKHSLYHSIRCARKKNGEDRETTTLYEKVLEIQTQTLSPNHSHCANFDNCIGIAYGCIAEYLRAFSFHETALAIRQKLFLSHHPDFVATGKMIDLVYSSMSEDRKNILFLGKDLQIGLCRDLGE